MEVKRNGTRRWDRPMKFKGSKYSFRSADLDEQRFSFLFEREAVPRCNFCRKSLGNEKFFYKIGKAVARESISLYGVPDFKADSYLMCRLCWHDRKMDVA